MKSKSSSQTHRLSPLTVSATAVVLLSLAMTAGAQTAGQPAARTMGVAPEMSQATAQSASQPAAQALRGTLEKALETNPEVTARFHAYRAAAEAIDIARGGMLPHLDLNAAIGRERREYTTGTTTFNRTGVGLTLSQLLWDGLGTVNQVKQSNHESLARYFDLLSTVEETALEAARAHYDVLRYRRLVELAEDNYVQHRYAALRIDSRTQAGVGRGVDSEQVGARQALAESNLTTEVANLHDVTARYQRIVGESPPAHLATTSLLPPRLDQQMPASEAEAVSIAIKRSPSVSASVESVRAARAAVSIREAAFQPRIEARLRAGTGRNYESLINQQNTAAAEVLLNWNLFNGGSDRARVRQQSSLLNQAADLRDKACRDARQVVSIAYNDTRRLAEQLQQLQRNTAAILKTRDAYRQQFDTGIIGRSLLDLLNSENEVYTAQRAYANAEHDLGLAYARTQAATTQLTSVLGLAGPGAVTGPNVDNWSADGDAPGRCPVLVPEIERTAQSVLDSRAEQMQRNAMPPAGSSTPGLPAAAPLSPTSGTQPARIGNTRQPRAITPPRAVAPSGSATVPSMGATPSVPSQGGSLSSPSLGGGAGPGTR